MSLIAPRALWEARQAGRQALCVIDASWHMPAAQRDPRAEHAERRIPSASYFDLDGCSAGGTDLPHMLPTAAQFGATTGALGVSRSSHVVVYDASDRGVFSSPRLWWMFRLFGHGAVSVLDGGLRRWEAEGFEVESGPPPATEPGDFVAAAPREELLWSHERVLEHVRRAQELQGRTATLAANKAEQTEHRFAMGPQLLDARPNARFTGEAPEPRPGLPSGHMPGAKSLPFDALLDARTGGMLPVRRNPGPRPAPADAPPAAGRVGCGVRGCGGRRRALDGRELRQRRHGMRHRAGSRGDARGRAAHHRRHRRIRRQLEPVRG